MKIRYFLLIIILVLAAFLRFYRIGENLFFSSETAHNYLSVKNFIAARQIPLYGPPTSHPWLYFGPLFYWLLIPFFLVFGYDPVGPAILFAIIGTLTVLLNYFVIKNIIDRKTALLSSLFISVSPLFLDFTRGNRFYSLVIPINLIYYYFLYELLKGRRKFIFFLGLILGIIFNFHYSSLILIPSLVILIIIFKINIKLKDWLKFFLGIFIPSIPIFIYASFNRFEMIRNLILWIPYRILGFAGIIQKNNPGPSGIAASINSINLFFRWLFLPDFGNLDYIFSLILIALIIFTVFNIYGKKEPVKNGIGLIILITHIFIGIILLVIHGNPPIHYFIPLFIIPFALLSFIITRVSKYQHINARLIILFIFFLILLKDFSFYFSPRWFYSPYENSYQKLVDSMKLIKNDANGVLFNLSRVGDFDYYEYHYAQNYRYVLFLLGQEPVDWETGRIYTIYENPIPNTELSDVLKILRNGNITILRIDKSKKMLI